MRHMQQNIGSPAKDIKTFTLTDSEVCGVTKSAVKQASKHFTHSTFSSDQKNTKTCMFLMTKILYNSSFEKNQLWKIA